MNLDMSDLDEFVHAKLIPLDAGNFDHLILDTDDHQSTKLGIHHPSSDQDRSSISSSSPSLHQDHDSDEQPSEADGFKTPTDSDHKIPATTQCPAPPRKPKPSPELRKVRSGTVRRRLEMELSRRELESMLGSDMEFSDPSYTPKLKRRRKEVD